MPDDTECDCLDTANTTAEPTDGRVLADEDILAAELPAQLAAALGRLLDDEPINTLDAWVTEVRRLTGGGPIAVEDLCLETAETSHWGEVAGDRYYFSCFYDAVILAALAAAPVTIRTESPDGTIIRARAAGSDVLMVTPTDAVFSFGIAEQAASPADGDPTHAMVYGMLCPYIKAFPDAAAYERWAASVPAATVAMPLAGATELAAALVR